MRGRVEVLEDEESEREVEQEVLPSGASTPVVIAGPSTGPALIAPATIKETKEEKRTRRAEKAQRKAEKEMRRQEKEKKTSGKVDRDEVAEQPIPDEGVQLVPATVKGLEEEKTDAVKVKKRKKEKSSKSDGLQADGDVVAEAGGETSDKNKKRKKRRKGDDTASS